MVRLIFGGVTEAGEKQDLLCLSNSRHNRCGGPSRPRSLGAGPVVAEFLAVNQEQIMMMFDFVPTGALGHEQAHSVSSDFNEPGQHGKIRSLFSRSKRLQTGT